LIEKIEAAHAGGKTKVTVRVSGAIDIASQRIENPPRVFVDFQSAIPALSKKADGAYNRAPQSLSIHDPYLKQIRLAENQRGVTRVVLDLTRADLDYQTSVVGANQLVIEIVAVKGKLTNPLAPAPTALPAATPTSAPSLVSSAAAPTLAAKPTKIAPVYTAARPSSRPGFKMPEPPSISLASRLPKAEAGAIPYKISGYVLRDFRAVKPPTTPVGRQAAAANSAVAAATMTSAGKRSLTRVLGLKVGRVVIDAGHGGHDHGSTGPNGLTEKEVTLDVARRLGELIEENLGSEVVFTRNDDRYIQLEERGAIANRSHADLFISIHANSSRHSAATGVETYYLNFTSSPEALEVAARENAVSERSVSDLGDLIKKIALKDKIDESREFAGKVQMALYNGASKAGNRTKDRGVRKAPFVVLIGATMPSILTEIGFLSNPKEEALLKRGDYRQKIAEALFRGISQYAGGLSHFNVARNGGDSSSPE
jgi:N-acetylmuramoyl-L-alanine amidase